LEAKAMKKIYEILFLGFKFEEILYPRKDSKTFNFGRANWVSKQSFVNVIFYPLEEKNFLELTPKQLISSLEESKYYKNFLSFCNGLIAFSGSITFYGVTTKFDLEYMTEPVSLINELNGFKNPPLVYIGQAYYSKEKIGYFVVDKRDFYKYKYINIDGGEIQILKEWQSIEELMIYLNKYFKPFLKENGELKDTKINESIGNNKIIFR
jgi:hypothetical protein